MDEGGRIIGVSLNARDVSERKHAERALRESEARYRDLFDNASDLVCATDREGRFLYVNRAWHEGTGYSDTELAALRFGDLVHPDSKARCAEVMERALAGETLTHVELTLMPRSGIPIVVEGNLSGARQSDGSVLLRGIYRDVTERKRVDEQLRRAERMQAAGRLAGGMAHEVNNMMTGVIGFAEFLLRGLPPEDPRRSEVQEIIRAGSRAADVTRQLLAFTRQQLMHPEVLAINDVVLGLEKMLRHSLGENHELELRLDGGLGQIRADRGQLEQVLINLILNARDALPARGRVTIASAAAELDEVYAARHGDVGIAPGAYLLLSVSDTGCGMDPEVQAKIFEPFFTTKPVGQGTGLGLSTVYGIVKQSGGFIWCYSEPRLGSTFKVYLPVLQVAPVALPPASKPVAPRGGSETVLVVEDEDVVRSMTCRGLREHGYTVLEARNGAEALAVVEENLGSIDLVVSDVVMPEVGGRELAARLTLLDPALPVLYMSGYTGEDVVQRGLMDADAPVPAEAVHARWAGPQRPGAARLAGAPANRAGDLGDRLRVAGGLGVLERGPELEVLGAQDDEAPRRREPGEPLPGHVHHPLRHPGKDRRDAVPLGRVELRILALVVGTQPGLNSCHRLLLAGSAGRHCPRVRRTVGRLPRDFGHRRVAFVLLIWCHSPRVWTGEWTI